MSLLTSTIYNRIEKKELPNIPIPVIMAFTPKAFIESNYPIRIESFIEMRKFVDHNFEPLTDEIFKINGEISNIAYKNNFTKNESKLFREIQNKVGNFTKKNYKMEIKPLGNLLVQQGPMRVINMFNSCFEKTIKSKLKIFEIGPGHGYLGALMVSLNYSYFSYDITQSLYIWQNHLFNLISKKNFNESIGRPISEIQKTNFGHFAWWQMYELLMKNNNLNFDIVYSNSNLSEMTPYALKFNLSFIKEKLSRSDVGVFFYFSTGNPSFNSEIGVLNEILKCGFNLVFDKPFYCFCLDGNNRTKIKNQFKNGILPSDNNENNLKVSDFMDMSEKSLPLDFNLSKKFIFKNYNE